MAIAQKLILTITLLFLAACRSDSIQFHTLTPAQPWNFPPLGGAEIQIDIVTVPPQVDRQQIVIRQSNSSLAILETQWWSASLADEMRSALADRLLSGGIGRKVSVRLDVQRFDSFPGQYALVDITWRIRNQGIDDNILLTCRSIYRTPAGSSVNDIVIAHQSNIQKLATDINKVVRTNTDQCPPTP
ncbi:hypothetical protein SAMN05660489_06337 [Pseudomonas sp. LAMO17WK12:I10]|uniref:PqiC family protein n=1 Tax=unclassified Pseudomonas TaxID=196821 RepID=UPI000BDA4F3A|nr:MULTISPECIES: PqiC family protein [unclassified Pseudomonas]PXX51543.1 hypothetical protein H160_06347 [Pseudomonas sp. LAMO17WK12:I9]SNY53934.1 hypothetical protein SAMN05660489_06337 [Pseudomonas sp. LAMO17WK12:I10]